MRRILMMLILGSIVVWVGCSDLKVRTDYERGIDFSKFKTFDFYRAPADAPAAPFIHTRIKQAIVREFQGKGLTRSPENPDLLVAIHTDVEDKIDVNYWGYSYAQIYYSGYWGPQAGGVHVQHYQKGTLVIDLVDNSDDELVWRGMAQRALPEQPSPDRIDSIVNDAVKWILKDYPPR